MQIRLASVMVENQDKALRFYTTILGFVKSKDIPMGQFRWLTVTSGIPATAFITNNVQSEYQRLKALGVGFRGEPKSMGPITAVLFDDTCGNLINLVQPSA